ncbi:MAG: hypothetical protein DMD91_26495 [Candidatus Rokuibacteriota bacterium]|nr:MAG: hypothetical protein DMD91_26495 [Candidatus Rokubacteria bacterium]
MRLAIAGIILAFVGASVQAAGALPPAEVMRRIDEVQIAFRDARYGEALAASRKLVAEYPSVTAFQLLRGAVAEYVGEFDEARQAYTEARLQEPGNPLTHYRLGALFIRLGRYDQALAHLDDVVGSHAWDVSWRFLHGSATEKTESIKHSQVLAEVAQLKIDVLMEKGDVEQARAMARDFGIVRAGVDYCADARRQTSGSDRQRALNAYRLAALASPPHPECLLLYGRWLTDDGYIRLAQWMVRDSIRLATEPNHRVSGEHYLRIRLSGGREISKRAEQLTQIARQRFIRDGDRAGATQLLDEAMQLEPAFARPYLQMAMITWRQQEREAALGWLERALKVDPDCWRAWRNLGQGLVSLGRHAAAERPLRKALELFGDDFGARLQLARVLYAERRYDEFVRETRQALQLGGAVPPRDVNDVSEFLAVFERNGPGESLPPVPDPKILIGWSYD